MKPLWKAIGQALGVDVEAVEQAQAQVDTLADLGWSLPETPKPWVCVQVLGDGAMYVDEPAHLGLILSVARELDGRRWVHLSLSHAARLPRWSELVRARDAFLGPDAKAIQVLAPAREHVNFHTTTLHMWSCLDGDPLPDFTRGTGSI